MERNNKGNISLYICTVKIANQIATHIRGFLSNAQVRGSMLEMYN
jgi:hypothetical protein